MSFSCRTHGWRNHMFTCPICTPGTSSGHSIIIPDDFTLYGPENELEDARNIIRSLSSQLEREQKCVELSLKAMEFAKKEFEAINPKNEELNFGYWQLSAWQELDTTITKIKSLRNEK